MIRHILQSKKHSLYNLNFLKKKKLFKRFSGLRNICFVKLKMQYKIYVFPILTKNKKFLKKVEPLIVVVSDVVAVVVGDIFELK